MKKVQQTIKGEVIEELSGGRFMIRMGDLDRVCFLGGKMKFNHIRVLLGDKVEVVLDPYGGHATNRIVKRL